MLNRKDVESIVDSYDNIAKLFPTTIWKKIIDEHGALLGRGFSFSSIDRAIKVLRPNKSSADDYEGAYQKVDQVLEQIKIQLLDYDEVSGTYRKKVTGQEYWFTLYYMHDNYRIFKGRVHFSDTGESAQLLFFRFDSEGQLEEKTKFSLHYEGIISKNEHGFHIDYIGKKNEINEHITTCHHFGTNYKNLSSLKIIVGTFSTLRSSNHYAVAGKVVLEKHSSREEVDQSFDKPVPEAIFDMLYNGGRIQLRRHTNVRDLKELPNYSRTLSLAVFAGVYRGTYLRNGIELSIERFMIVIDKYGKSKMYVNSRDKPIYYGRFRYTESHGNKLVGQFELDKEDDVPRFCMYFETVLDFEGKYLYGTYSGIEIKYFQPICGKIHLELIDQKSEPEWNTVYEAIETYKEVVLEPNWRENVWSLPVNNQKIENEKAQKITGKTKDELELEDWYVFLSGDKKKSFSDGGVLKPSKND